MISCNKAYKRVEGQPQIWLAFHMKPRHNYITGNQIASTQGQKNHAPFQPKMYETIIKIWLCNVKRNNPIPKISHHHNKIASCALGLCCRSYGLRIISKVPIPPFAMHISELSMLILLMSSRGFLPHFLLHLQFIMTKISSSWGIRIFTFQLLISSTLVELACFYYQVIALTMHTSLIVVL